ncbi:Vacuolar protein sorting-associated protein ist1 [Malassezia obtusa]|uniref:Vacuolar protein sorting-associated protein ist1 n=1 Tax=Malassezia obtusa TaxID=76774 RepID=A0AAF0E4P7_9BASI|nr:Vacuolar protein sorting-associated protein ist1 [Malassezia obtusa]
MARWHSGRTRIQLKLATQRARMLQEKKESLAKQARRDIADLVHRGKLETARVKTESLILDDVRAPLTQVHIELLELLELYCETLYARFALLELPGSEPDEAIREPLLAILHAAHRTELTELHVLQDMLSTRYGAELAQDARENKDACVSPRVTRKLAFHMPEDALVDAYLGESTCDAHAVCRAYDVPLPGAAPAAEARDGGGTAPVAGAAGGAVSADSAAAAEDDAATDGRRPAPDRAAQDPPEWDALMRRFAALKRPS